MFETQLIRPSLLLDFVNSQSVDPRITFTRASTATYFDRFGVLRTAAVNEPRIDFDPATGECKGLLIEEQRTNLVIYSEALENWSFASGRVTLADKYYSGSVRYREVKKITSSSNESIYLGAINYESETYYVLTAVLRAGTTDKCSVGVYSSSLGWQYSAPTNGEVSIVYGPGTITKEGASLSHLSGLSPDADTMLQIKVKFSDTNQCHVYVYPGGPHSTTNGNSIGNSILITRVQLEKGEFPTSYIPTTSSQVTRSADSAVMTGTNFSSWYRQDEGTLFADIERPFADSSNRFSFAVFADASNYLGFDYSKAGSGNFYWRNGGAGFSSAGHDAGSPYRYAAAYGAGGYALTVNGMSVISGVSDTPPPSVNTLNLGRRAPGEFGRGLIYFKRLTYYPARLPNNQLQVLTT